MKEEFVFEDWSVVLFDKCGLKVVYHVDDNSVGVGDTVSVDDMIFDLKEFDDYFLLFDYLYDLMYDWCEGALPEIREKVDFIFHNRHLFCKMFRTGQYKVKTEQ